MTQSREYVKLDGEYGVIETVIGDRARINLDADIPDRLKDSIRTTSVDDISTSGDYVEVNGEFGVVEAVIGSRVRVNIDAVGPDDMSGGALLNPRTASG